MTHINKRITKNTGNIAAGTLLSRAAGFVRDMLLARYFGVSWIVEAFFVALRIPNLLRELIGEGGVDSVAVPVLSGYRKGPELVEAQNKLFSITMYVSAVLVIAGICLSKFLVLAIAPGFAHDLSRFVLTVRLTQVLFLFLFFVVLASSLGAMLYTLKEFFIPAVSPICMNLCMIAVLLVFQGSLEHMAFALALSVIVSGILQGAAHYYGAFRRGFRFKIFGIAVLKTAFAGKLMRLFWPRLVTVSLYQLNVFIDTVYASFSSIVGEGAVAALYYTNRLYQFPLALVSLAVARAMLPELAELKRKNMEEFKRTLSFSLESVAYWIIPGAFLIVFFPVTLIEAVFMRGQFDSYSTVITATALFGYAAGLVFIAANRVLVNSFYALEDTKTPAKVAARSLCINVIASGILMFPFQVGGITAASSIAAFYSWYANHRILSRKIGVFVSSDLRRNILKMCVGSAVMCAAIGVGLSAVPIRLLFLRCGLVFCGGGLLYVAVTHVLNVPAARAIIGVFFRNRGRD